MGLTTAILSQRKYVDDGNKDGTMWSQTPRSNPKQAPTNAWSGGQCVTYCQGMTVLVTATITCAEQTLTVGTTAGWGPQSTDFFAMGNKDVNTAGLGFMGGRVSAANTMGLSFCNPTAAGLTPSANATWNFVVLRGAVTVTQSVTPSVVPTKGTVETIINLAPTTQATFTLTTNAAGQITSAAVVSGGAGYYALPSIVVTDTAFTGPQGGFGAVLKCNVSGGAITQVFVDDPGMGYVTPVATAVGGNIIEYGMFAMVNKPTQTAGIAISNVRVSGNNQIAIQMINPTAAAITPTAENYVFCALNDIVPMNNLVQYGMVATGVSSVASITSSEQSITVNGLLATDAVMGVSKPTLSVGLGLAGSRVSAANTLQLGFINSTQNAVTPTATEVYAVSVYRQQPELPFKRYFQLLTPASVAANTSAEQTFTVTGLPFTIQPSTVWVNKPSHTYGLGIGGCRVTAASTLGITFVNTTAAAITPAAENYVIGCFNAIGPLTGAPGSWEALAFNQSMQDVVGTTVENNDLLTSSGFQKGA